MGIIKRLKSTILTERNVISCPPIQEIVVHNDGAQKATTMATDQCLTDLHKASRSETKRAVNLKNPRQRQRIHVDRLYNISHQHVEESLRRVNQTALTQAKFETIHSSSKKTRKSSLQKSAIPTKLVSNEDKVEDSLGTVDTTHGSCSVVELFSGLYLCGCDGNIAEEDAIVTTPLIERKKVKPVQSSAEVLVDSKLPSVPREISFTARNEKVEMTNHVLLSEVDENVSLASSILSRLRRRRRRATSLPKMRVYVEKSHGINRARSVELSVLTEPDK